MTLKDLADAITEVVQLGYKIDTVIHVKGKDGELKEIEGFHVGKEGKIFIK